MIGRIKLLVLLCIFGTTLSLRIPYNKRQSACADMSITTDKTDGYKVLSDYGITIDDSENIKIKLKIKASHDAEIALMSTDNTNDPLYKIVLGGSGNTVSMIQAGKNGKIKALFHGAVLNQDEFSEFLITWKNNKIKVKNGDKIKILQWKDKKNPLNVVNVGIATKDSQSGVWLFPCNQGQCDVAAEFECKKGSTCIPVNERCNGIANCLDGSDECGCDDKPNPSPTPETCPSDELACDNGEGCYPKDWKCDDIKDCGDNSDEENCEAKSTPAPTSVPGECSEGEFKCDTTEECFVNSWKCDEVTDCSDGSDEANCEDKSTPAPTSVPGECSEGEFKCDTTDECYVNSWKCDEVTDCSDGSDEENCGDKSTPVPTSGPDNSTPVPTSGPTSAPGGCSDGEFKCDTTNQCFVNSWRCDDISDCDDGSDEKNCATNAPVTQAPTDCTSEADKCNGYADCVDGSDEDSTMCSKFNCPSGKSKCSDGLTCISDSAKCDGYQDCPAGDDEANCAAATCSSKQFKCPNSFCLAKSGKCNGIPECPNGEDENGCSGCPKSTQKRCSDGSMCVLKAESCDGFTDCSDKSDEANCGSNPSRRMTLKRFQRLLTHLKSRNKRSPNHQTTAQKALKKMDQVKRNIHEALRREKSEGVKRHQRAMKARHESLQRQLVERRRNLAMTSRHSMERRHRQSPTH
ncbi:low-density lipoprotein receptor-related protein 2-like isoform X1 [Mytilus californianus]|uniref:low-density lipoprotein receptor-related protein 2-like isoform X1 n=1 Tax=Mytilus californianus TaxID=6549 RepID=UPI002246934F|nr:low-density lipoprotein receptor-related protein 2-like isoform X1 [Mytilus californianus]